jgi:hypothetical protein
MRKIMIACVSLLLLSAACWSDDSGSNANEVKYYDNAKVVRIKSAEGECFVLRSYDEGREEATANLPVFEKDTVGTTDGRLAIYLGRLNYLRLNDDSEVILEKIPQLRKTDLAVRLEQGDIYLDIENMDREKEIEVQTPDCGVFLLDKGVYRINVKPDAATEVVVMEGIAEVAGRDESRNVRENQKIVMTGGEVEERPYYFYASDKDDFDRWNEDQNRELGYARYSTSRYLQSGYEDTEYEMSRAGRWSYMSEFNSYVWIPYTSGADWMPYANGRWVWNPYYGYVWASYDACGWFTHHYGRWQWDYAFGWYWIPSYHWSPAWVSWFWDDYYYGWCPLSWWNRPVIIINHHWDRNFNYHRGIPRECRSTIIIRKNELSAANINRIALRRDALAKISEATIAYRGGAPADHPPLEKATVINARGQSVLYKQGGIVSSDKYRAHGSDISASVNKYEYTPRGEDATRAAGKKAIEGNRSTEVTRYKSRSDSGSSNSASSRYSSSDSSSGKSSGKAVNRGKSGQSAQSSGSSASGSSSGTAKKKKKGDGAYLSRYQGGRSTGEGESQDRYSSVRSYGYSSRYYNSRATSRDDSGSQGYSTLGSLFRSDRSAGSYRSGTAGLSSFSREYRSAPASGGYAASASRHSSSASLGSYRSAPSGSSSSRSSSSSSSHSSGGVAVKKK